jgi:hypothetical protein
MGGDDCVRSHRCGYRCSAFAQEWGGAGVSPKIAWLVPGLILALRRDPSSPPSLEADATPCRRGHDAVYEATGGLGGDVPDPRRSIAGVSHHAQCP